MVGSDEPYVRGILKFPSWQEPEPSWVPDAWRQKNAYSASSDYSLTSSPTDVAAHHAGSGVASYQAMHGKASEMKRCCTRPKRLTQGAPHATPTAGQLGIAHATSSPWLAALTLTPFLPAGPSDSSAFAVESPRTPPCSCGEAQRAAAEGQSCRMPVSTARSALPPLLMLALMPALPVVPAITVLGPDGATQRVDPIDAPL